jgi:hypothetical protein
MGKSIVDELRSSVAAARRAEWFLVGNDRVDNAIDLVRRAIVELDYVAALLDYERARDEADMAERNYRWAEAEARSCDEALERAKAELSALSGVPFRLED